MKKIDFGWLHALVMTCHVFVWSVGAKNSVYIVFGILGPFSRAFMTIFLF